MRASRMPRSLLLLFVPLVAISASASMAIERPVSEPVYGPAPYLRESPAVASDGDNFLVVWEDERGYPDKAIYAARITPGGELLDPTGIRIASGALGLPIPLFAGNAYVILWPA